MTKFYIKLFDDELNNEQLAMLDGFLEGPLDVPKHHILHFLLLIEDFLESLEVSFNSAVYHGATLSHELHEPSCVVLLHAFNLLPISLQNEQQVRKQICELSLTLGMSCRFD